LIAFGKNSSICKLYSELKDILIPIVCTKNKSRFIKKEFKISKKQLQTVMSPTPLEDLLAEKSAVLFR
jgi:hypothetical protein